MDQVVSRLLASYETDFYGWTMSQAALLRARHLDALDIENIAEELECLGRSEKRELVSRLTVLLMHLMKWQLQPGGRGKSWRQTVEIQRSALHDHLEENPSLIPETPTAIVTAHKRAVRDAVRETNLAPGSFPIVCPWTYDQVVDEAFWPD